MVITHELGHFVLAKRAGVKVEEFGLGYPPRICGYQRDNITKKLHFFWGRGKKNKKLNKQNTIYSLNWIPFGGFNRIKGMDEIETENDSTLRQAQGERKMDSFSDKSLGKRILILSGGVLTHLLLAIILLSIVFSLGAPEIIEDNLSSYAKIKDESIQIFAVFDDSPAKQAGVEIGDKIIKIDNQLVKETIDIQSYLNQTKDKKVNLQIERNQESLSIDLTPQLAQQIISTNELPAEMKDKFVLGLQLAKVGRVSYPFPLSIWQGIKATFVFLYQIIIALIQIIIRLFNHQSVGQVLTGPIGVAVLTAEVTKLGFVYLLQFTALLAINFALINILPFPALDGGQISFLIVEGIRGKPNNKKIEILVNNLGFFILIGLMLLVTYQDIIRYGGKIIRRILNN